jgi:hypothetical protein
MLPTNFSRGRSMMSVGWRVATGRKRHNLRKLQGQIRAGGKERHLNCITKAVELAFGVTAKVEQVDLLWSTERPIGSLSRKRDTKECTASFLPHAQLYSYYAAVVKCPWCGSSRKFRGFYLLNHLSMNSGIRRIRAGIFTNHWK